jgi:nitrite reductase (NADH) small subunit
VPGSEETASRRCHVGHVDDFDRDACTIVTLAGREIGIIRTDRGVFAVLNRCPHMGGSICRGTVTGIMTASSPQDITYDDRDKAIRCPWHGWEFMLNTGFAVGGITNRRLRRFDVEVEDGNVYVHLRGSPRDATATATGT